MFAMYDGGSERRRRKKLNPGTVAISIFAHAAVAGAVFGFAKQAEARPVTEEVIAEWNLEPKPTPPPPPPPKVELPPAPKEPPHVDPAPRLETPREHPRTPPPPVKGDFVTPRPPTSDRRRLRLVL